MSRFAFLVLLATLGGILGLAACQSQAPETPVQATQAILELYRAQDFDALIRTRYAEIGKAEGEDQIQTLVDRFQQRFSDDEARAQAISIYETLLTVTPELSADGTMATFPVNGGFVRLSKMPDGRWGFHL